MEFLAAAAALNAVVGMGQKGLSHSCPWKVVQLRVMVCN